MGEGIPGKGISVGFDAKRAFFNYSGLGNYSRNLISALVRYYPDNDYILFTPSEKDRIKFTDEAKFRIKSPSGLIGRVAPPLWRTWYINNDIRNLGLDIYHGLSQELPSGIESTGSKSVVTVHDLIFLRFPGYYNRADVAIYKKKMVLACRAADRIVAVSRQTKADLMEMLNVPGEKISVIYQGCNPWFRDFDMESAGEDIRTKYNLPEKYLLYVSTIEERKNLLGILKAMKISDIGIPLVVIGRKSKRYFGEVMKYINASGLKNIIFPGGIANTELPSIYRNAECLVYPSFFEGFGIPVLEALVSGTPVITSRGGCFAEAGGPESIYIDPHEPAEIGEAILRVLNNNDLRSRMINAGKSYASGFSEDGIARNYMELYKSLLG